MPLILRIDDSSNRPMFRQIMDQIMSLVDRKALKPGDRLPSTRNMADRLSVNRSTVYKAYQELWALGYVDSTPGSYSTVRPRPKIAGEGPATTPGRIDWSMRVTPASEELLQAYEAEQALMPEPVSMDSEMINFIPLAPDSRLFPVEAFRKSMNHVLTDKGTDLLEYGDPLGYKPLRQYISERMRLHQIRISPDEIMITTGAQNALELLAKLLTGPGDAIILETPTYSRALSVFRLSNVRLVNAPMNGDGMDLDALEKRLSVRRPALIYTMPNFHNPTGITTDQGHRERLLRICDRYRVPLVEDGFEEEMKYFGKAVLPIKSMDHGKIVIYIGTFSKVLFPGLRIGWIAADREVIERLRPIQRALILSGNQVDQAALDRFCRQGHYDRHIQRIHRIYRKRMTTALDAMATEFSGKHVDWSRPAGGYTIWVRLKRWDGDEQLMVKKMTEHGVGVLPGSTHFYGDPGGIYFRLSIANLDEQQIQEGINRIARCLDTMNRGRRTGKKQVS
ncbi:MAG: PLP-dependent aminotransferase family protein [Desulfobacteraceae bacterium]|nr:PLP-dependent aminotransferase family protein [Desulfobacteraceae bacterium]